MPERCAPSAQTRGDDLAGTAARNARYLLVEQPGPWGRHALTGSQLDPAIGRAVAERASAAGARPLLIRRPGRSDPEASKQWFLADTSPSGSTRTGTFTQDSELLSLLDELEAGHAPGRAYDEPLFLVCTHGRHDACCAIRGRPVAASFAELEPAATWECSHIGGDRFAANVLVLPQGLTYGWVEPGDAGELVAEHRAGRVLSGLLRGRASDPPPVQAAQRHARLLLGELGIDALAPLRVTPASAKVWDVELEHPTGPIRLRLQQVPGGEPGRLTCSSLTAAAPPRWQVLGSY